MATTDEKQELVEDIKRPIRYYRIRLWGYGGELVYGRSSKEEYEFWNSDYAKDLVGYDPNETISSPVQIYMWEKDGDPERFENVPDEFKREGEWFEQDDIEHMSGVEPGSCYIEITEVDSNEYSANEIETVVDDASWYEGFYEDNDIDLVVEESAAFDEPYLFYGYSAEKGQFYEGTFESKGRIDFSKLKFYMMEFPSGEEMIYIIEYDGEEIDNEGLESNQKGLYIEIQDLS